MPPSAIVLFRGGGHREHWANVLAQLFAVRVRVEAPSFSLLMNRGRVIYLTADDCVLFSIVSGLFRAMLGRRTDLLLLSSARALKPINKRRRLLRWTLKLFQLQSRSQVFTIGFFPDAKEIKKLVHGLLPDLNLIDLGRPGSGTLGTSPPIKVRGKPLILSVGLQCPARGAQLLIEAFCRSDKVRARFEVCLAGSIDGIERRTLNEFKMAGGTLREGWIEEVEMLSLLSSAHIVFCVFAPEYDQSSGVFGHATQLNRRCIVRTDSILHSFQQRKLGYSLACRFDPDDLVTCLLELDDAAQEVPLHSAFCEERTEYVQKWQRFLNSRA